MTLNDFITLHLNLVNLKINKKKSTEYLNKNCKIEAIYNYKNIKLFPNTEITTIKLFYNGY